MDLTPHQQRLLAATAFVDTRTLKRFLNGDEVRATCEDRIVRAAKKLKLSIKPRRTKR